MEVSREFFLSRPGQVDERIHVCPQSPDPSKPFRCKTLYSAVSTGTETSAWLGLPHLRHGVTYPRAIGYLNASRIQWIDPRWESSTHSFSEGDIILTHKQHMSHFDCSPDEILAKIASEEEAQKAIFAHIFYMGECALRGFDGSLPENVYIIGGGLLGTATAELACALGIPCVFVTDHASRPYLEALPAKILNRTMLGARPQKPTTRANSVVMTTSRWDDFSLGLVNLAPRGLMTVMGFPGRSGDLPPFNPLEPKLFYAKELTVRALPTCVPQRQTGRRGNVCPDTSYGEILALLRNKTIGQFIDYCAAASPESLDQVYEALLSPDRQELSYVLDWSLLTNHAG